MRIVVGFGSFQAWIHRSPHGNEARDITLRTESTEALNAMRLMLLSLGAPN